MEDLSRSVKLYCPACGCENFTILDEFNDELANAPDFTRIKCANCKSEFTKKEIISENQYIINENIEEIQKDAIKDIIKTLKWR